MSGAHKALRRTAVRLLGFSVHRGAAVGELGRWT